MCVCCGTFVVGSSLLNSCCGLFVILLWDIYRGIFVVESCVVESLLLNSCCGICVVLWLWSVCCGIFVVE